MILICQTKLFAMSARQRQKTEDTFDPKNHKICYIDLTSKAFAVLTDRQMIPLIPNITRYILTSNEYATPICTLICQGYIEYAFTEDFW